MPHYTLVESTPSVPPGITCRYFLADAAQTDGRTILVVAFQGEYPDGSRGNAHGAYIATATLHGLHAFDADCLILDFRGLSYRWGNTLLKVLQDVSQFKDAEAGPDEPPFPIAVVTSEKCREAFLSLVTPMGRPTPGWHFDDIDAAIQYGVKKANEWLDS